jgi:hypothetical protein
MIRTAQLIALVSIALATGASRADEGCSKDTDCKGERICVQRECVDTEARAEMPANAVPASFKPAPAPAASSTPPETSRPTAPVLESNVNRHLGGFVRPDLGFGYLTTSGSLSGMDATISGVAGTFGIAVGGAISENQVLAFHLWDMVVTNPTITSGSNTASNVNATLTLIAFGPEYTTYSKDNFYASFSPALTRASITSNGSTTDTNYGFGLRTALGKEWWVSDHWGLGLAAHVSFSVNQVSGSTNPPTWTGWGATIAFSATYN